MAGPPSLCHSTLDSSPAAPGTGVGPGITPSAFGRSTVGTFTGWERAKKQSPERQGNVFVLSAGLPPFPPPALGITSPMKPNPLSCLWDFQRLNAPSPMEQVWAAERARRRRRNVKSIFSLLAELFDLDIAFLRITEILIK